MKSSGPMNQVSLSRDWCAMKSDGHDVEVYVTSEFSSPGVISSLEFKT